MRVVHAVQTAAFGGVESYVARLSSAQAEAGDEVTVIGGDVERVRQVVGDRVRVVIPAATLGAVWSAVRRRVDEVDVVHAHMTAAEMACSVALLGSRVPLVCTRHFAQRRGRNILVHVGSSVFARNIAAQISVSRFVADSIEGPSVLVYPGVPPRPPAVPWTDREPVVLVAQRLEAEKSTEDAIHAFARSGLASEGWRLDVAGDGARRPALERKVRGLGMTESVRFLGHRSDVTELMERSRILFASSPSEHFGLSVIEAMASGLPVVATASGGHLETLGSAPGAALYPPGDIEAAGRALRELAHDPGRWSAYSRQLQRVQQGSFTLERQERETRRVYESVV